MNKRKASEISDTFPVDIAIPSKHPHKDLTTTPRRQARFKASLNFFKHTSKVDDDARLRSSLIPVRQCQDRSSLPGKMTDNYRNEPQHEFRNRDRSTHSELGILNCSDSGKNQGQPLSQYYDIFDAKSMKVSINPPAKKPPKPRQPRPKPSPSLSSPNQPLITAFGLGIKPLINKISQPNPNNFCDKSTGHGTPPVTLV